jgi:hypothetical protein
VRGYSLVWLAWICVHADVVQGVWTTQPKNKKLNKLKLALKYMFILLNMENLFYAEFSNLL